MAKKQMEEDLLTGGNLGDKKSSDKKAAAAAKKIDKINRKKEAINAKLAALKEKTKSETDEKKKAKLENEIKKLSQKLSPSGGKGIAPDTMKTVKAAVCIVVVVALLVTYVATGAVRKGFVSYLGIPAQYFTGMTVTNGENKAKIKVSTYNYYFAVQYNSLQSQQSTYESYGLDLADYNLDVDFDQKLSKQTTTNDDGKEVTWAEYLHEEVLESIQATYTYYLEAVAANDGEEPEITEDQQDEIDETLSEYKETANGYGYTLSGYLVQAMGKGVTESVFRREAKISYIAQNYQEQFEDEQLEKEYTDEELSAYQEEHYDELVSVDIKLFECESEDEAKAFKKALKSDGSNFADLCSEYSSDDFYKTAYKDDSYSTMYGVTESMLSSYAIGTGTQTDSDDEDSETTYPGLEWIFSTDRKAGDAYQYSTSVVYVISPVSLSDRETVNVRHILISPITDEDDDTDAVDATDEQWQTAYDTAKSILTEWKNGEKTEDSFAELAEENSTDTGSSSDGGLYEDIYPGEMVDPFANWCFDADRKAGDTGIVKSDYGYHIMYFVGKTGTAVWEYTAQQQLASDDSSSAITELEDSYEIKVNWLGSRYFEKDTDIDS